MAMEKWIVCILVSLGMATALRVGLEILIALLTWARSEQRESVER